MKFKFNPYYTFFIKPEGQLIVSYGEQFIMLVAMSGEFI